MGINNIEGSSREGPFPIDDKSLKELADLTTSMTIKAELADGTKVKVRVRHIYDRMIDLVMDCIKVIQACAMVSAKRQEILTQWQKVFTDLLGSLKPLTDNNEWTFLSGDDQIKYQEWLRSNDKDKKLDDNIKRKLDARREFNNDVISVKIKVLEKNRDDIKTASQKMTVVISFFNDLVSSVTKEGTSIMQSRQNIMIEVASKTRGR